MKLKEPFLACNDEWDYNNPPFKFPVYVSSKMDGIRCWDPEGDGYQSRWRKDLGNDYIIDTLNDLAPPWCDGEIVIPGKTFHETQSIVSTRRGKPEFRFYIFDHLQKPAMRYINRLKFLLKLHPGYVYNLKNGSIAEVLHGSEVNNTKELLKAFRHSQRAEEEGLIIRDDSPYKSGRSTLTGSPMMLKMVEWRTDECTIIGFNEKMAQKNPTAPCEAGKIPLDTLGSFQVLWKQHTFNLAGKLSEEEEYIWDHQAEYRGKPITFKYKTYGMKDKPRQPIFLGIREELPTSTEQDSL